MPWFFSLLIGLAISVVAYLLRPKPQKAPPPAVQDLDAPTAEAGRAIPVVFGSIEIKGLNVLYVTDKLALQMEIPV